MPGPGAEQGQGTRSGSREGEVSTGPVWRWWEGLVPALFVWGVAGHSVQALPRPGDHGMALQTSALRDLNSSRPHTP